MTLDQLRAYHVRAHTGYIWNCAHCAAEYWRLMQEPPAAVPATRETI